MNPKKIFILSLVTSSLLFATQKPMDLEKIVTIGTKSENSLDNLPMQVTLITQDQILNSGASNIADVLNSEGSIYLNTSGGNGAIMSVRGMAQGDTLILIDGRRVTGEFSKTYELDRIPASMVERIEIVKGSSSLLYGSDAMGGVINIITKKSKKPFSGDIQVVHGKNKNAIDGNILGTINNTSYRVYANYLDRDAFNKQEKANIKIMQSQMAKSPSALSGGGGFALLKNSLNNSYSLDRDYQDELELYSIGANITQKLNDIWSIRGDLSYMNEEKNGDYVSSIYETNYKQNGNSIKAKNVPVEQFDDNTRKTFGLGVDYKPNDKFDLRYDISYSKYEKDRKVYTDLWKQFGYSSKNASVSSVNESTIKHINNDLMGVYKFSDKSKITSGAEYRQTDVESTAFSVDDRNYKGLFIQHEYQALDKLNFVYGARYDKDSIGEDEVSFSFGTSYSITNNTIIKANYSEAFRSPDDRELYVDQTSPSGKKMLGSTVINTSVGKTSAWEVSPETSDTIELGVVTSDDIWRFDASIFKTDIDNRISRITVGNYFSFKNINDSEIKGFETSLSVAPIDQFMAKVTYSNISAENKTDDTDITYTPDSLASLTLSYFPLANLELKSITKYVGEQKDDTNQDIKSYTLTNLKAIYSDALKSTDIFLGVDNAFGESIPNELGAIEKANYYVGLRYKF